MDFKPRFLAILLIFLCPANVESFHLTCSLRNDISSSKTDWLSLNSVPPRRAYEGLPSTPGWKGGQLDRLTDWAVNDEANRPVICEYEPEGTYLWSKWKGTVLQLIYPAVIFNTFVGILVAYSAREFADSTWPLFAIPPQDDYLIQQLHGFNLIWSYQVTLTTFILTFFTSEAYKHWKDVYFATRRIQGRINDICMLVTIGATTPNEEDKNELVKKCTRLIKLSHTFFWASTPTSSNGVVDGGWENDEDIHSDIEIGPILLSNEGLQGLVDVGELTTEEVDSLLSSGLPPSQYTYVLLEWVGLLIMDGLERNVLQNGNSGLEENILRQMSALRAEYFSIGDYAAGRMSLAYVQLVQVLVDSLVFLAPVCLYSDVGSLSVPLVGLLTLFFKGLLELSKSFLDPFGNEGFKSQNIRVDVLVSELNFGAQSRWTSAADSYATLKKKEQQRLRGEELPISSYVDSNS
ncbi:unnamed protein product [Cylindrotheca closterium]|uniref:Uncharacterized protein n=1 Tax=Cylindrotheca closterium TaxID=2856 RepID=A0AAD2G883_9STRA|nr:unnamed protein product [Cylindrotheca closterium]